MNYLLGSLLLIPAQLGGPRVDLIAISDGTGKHVWTPSGAPLKSVPLPPAAMKLMPGAQPNVRALFAAIGSAKPDRPGVAFQIVGGPVRQANAVIKDATGRRPRWIAYSVANHRGKTADVRVGVADGAWRTVGSVVPQGTAGLKKTGIGFLRMARPDTDRKKGNSVVVDVTLPIDPTMLDYRVQVLDRRGKPLPFLLSQTPRNAVLPNRIWFAGKYEVVGRVELQTRVYSWKVFKHVVLEK